MPGSLKNLPRDDTMCLFGAYCIIQELTASVLVAPGRFFIMQLV